MNATTDLAIPEAALSDYCRRNEIAYLALFGSASRGELGAQSDVDLLVEFVPGARIGFLALERMQRELSGLFNRPVDLVPMDGLKPVIRDSVLSDIEEIYAA